MKYLALCALNNVILKLLACRPLKQSRCNNSDTYDVLVYFGPYRNKITLPSIAQYLFNINKTKPIRYHIKKKTSVSTKLSCCEAIN